MIDPARRYQIIDGFGFSEAFGFGEAVQNAPSAQQTQALNYMFSTAEGAGFTILRNRIPADPGNTIEPTDPGSPSAKPTYVWNDDDQGQVIDNSDLLKVSMQVNLIRGLYLPGLLVTSCPGHGSKIHIC